MRFQTHLNSLTFQNLKFTKLQIPKWFSWFVHWQVTGVTQRANWLESTALEH